MIDTKLLLADNCKNFIKKIQVRKNNIDFLSLITKIKQQNKIKQQIINLLSEKNILSEKYFISKNKIVKLKIDELNTNVTVLKKELSFLKEKTKEILDTIPNIPCNKTIFLDKVKFIKKWGLIRKFNFKINDHIEIGKKLGDLDFNLAIKITGSKFSIIKNNLAKLQRSLINFMLDLHTEEHGYIEFIVPELVNNNSLYSTGHLPKFKEQLFQTNDRFNFGLIPTAEVPLTNLVRDVLIDRNKLPLKYVSYTNCFRKEAGSYSKHNKGLIRQHQFGKVELVQIVNPENALEDFNKIKFHVEQVLQKLLLPYRILQLPPKELSFSSCQTYDLEVWIPSQNDYIEISSCSWCSDFQARRMNAKFKNKSNKNQYVHTFNASGLAIGRTLVAILENYQEKDYIIIPKVLQRYMNIEKLKFKI